MADRPRMLPPIWLALALISMVVLDVLLPLAGPLPAALRFLGAPLIALGLGFILWCAGLFKRAQTTIVPFEESSALVQSGPYARSRNPIYTGMLAILAGTALALGTLSPWGVLPVFAWIIRTQFIAGEEAMLRSRFGAEYDAYCARVRRWL
jgi:protein-S-isoprenylcysteine O-methyltransferase Ste14